MKTNDKAKLLSNQLAALRETVDWIDGKRILIEAELRATQNSLRGQNHVVAVGYPGSNILGFLKELNGPDGNPLGFNFAGDSYNTPRFTPERARALAAQLNVKHADEKSNPTYVAMFDREAMEQQLEQLTRTSDDLRNEIEEA